MRLKVRDNTLLLIISTVLTAIAFFFVFAQSPGATPADSSVTGDLVSAKVFPTNAGMIGTGSGIPMPVPQPSVSTTISTTTTVPLQTPVSSGGAGAVSKVDSGLRETIRNDPVKSTDVIFHVPDSGRMKEAAKKIQQSGGTISGQYSIGNIITANVPNGRLESIASDSSIGKAWPEREVQVFYEEENNYRGAENTLYGFDGAGIKVAILDTGIDSSHEMLKGKVILEKDFTGGNNPSDKFGHGTHVAGITAGHGAYKGVAPGSSVINGKVLGDDGYGSDSNVIKAINWAVDPDGNDETDDGADVISMSLGGVYSDPFGPMSLAVKAATERGVVVVVASGNCGICSGCGGFKGVTTPGSSPYAITVGAIDENNTPACFSGREIIEGVGIKPDFMAPGKNIMSSVPGGYGRKSGTSMSTAHLAGAAALLLQMKPELNQSQMKELMREISKDMGLPGKDADFGYGILDMEKIQKMLVTPDPGVILYNGAPSEFTIRNSAGKDITITGIECGLCNTNFTENITIKKGSHAAFRAEAVDFDYNLPINVQTDATNFAITLTKATEEFSAFSNYNGNGSENFSAGNVSVLDIDKVYCDLADNSGNALCVYRGKWKNLPSRNKPELGMTRGELYYVIGDRLSGDGGGKYEEEDAYATVGSDFKLSSLSSADVSYAAGAMNKNGGFGCGSSWPWDCNVPNIKVACNSQIAVDTDPCFGYCDNAQGTTTCPISKKGDYFLNVSSEIHTKNADGDVTVVFGSFIKIFSLGCVKDGDCLTGGKCKISDNKKGTFCEYTNQCVSGSTECTSATKKRTCGDYDGNDFTEWGAPVKCSPIEACYSDNCVSPVNYCPACDLKSGKNHIKWTSISTTYGDAFKSILSKINNVQYISSDKWESSPSEIINNQVYVVDMKEAGRLDFFFCGDGLCSGSETIDYCSADCGKKHSYEKFPGGWSADITSPFNSEIFMGKDYQISISYKCNSYGYAYFPIDMTNATGKFTCGDMSKDFGCANEVVVKKYFSGSDCNNAQKQATLTFKIPSGGVAGNYNLKLGFWHGYMDGAKPKIDGSDGGFAGASSSKSVTLSEFHCSKPDQCSAEEYCSTDGFCKKDVCSPQGNRYCEDLKIYSCSADGSVKALEKTCAPDEICQSATCVKKTVCGNGVCESGENNVNCASDCISPCNNYCVTDTKYFDGKWNFGKCIYSSRLCQYGCFGGECLPETASPFKMSMDSAPGDMTVYKQPEDLLKITIESSKAQVVDFSPPSSLEYVSGPYSEGKASVNAGSTVLLFKVAKNAPNTGYVISAGNPYSKPVLKFSIINRPEFLIVTDAKALADRFGNDPSVSSVIRESYSMASATGMKGVVYDLGDYSGILGSRPWNSFSDYAENPLDPNVKDNSYMKNVADFINSKCNSCRNTVMVGDDFVIPMYRVDFNRFSGFNMFNFWINKHPETKFLYSDTPYIPKDVRPVGDIDTVFNEIRQDKGDKVVIITPDGQDYSELDGLKSVLISNYMIKSYNILQRESHDIDCFHDNGLKGNTLIIVGNRSSNNAVKCVPWFDVGSKPADTFKSSISLERNVWSDKSDYAIIVSGDPKMGIATLTDTLRSPIYNRAFMDHAQTVYVHDFSKPYNMITSGDYFQGFVLGKCEHVGDSLFEQSPCIASDVTVSFLPGIGALTDARDAFIYCISAVIKHEAMDRIFCVVSAGGAATSIGTVLAAPTVVGSVASETADIGLAVTKGLLKTVKASMKLFAGFERMTKVLRIADSNAMRKFFKLRPGDELSSVTGKMEKILSTSSRKFSLNELAKLDESALRDGISNIDEMENAVKGAEAVLGRYKTLDDFAPQLKGCVASSGVSTSGLCSPEKAREIVERLKNIGKHADENEFVEFLTTYTSRVDDVISEALESIEDLSKKLSPDAQKIIKNSKASSISGKVSEGLSSDILNKQFGFVLDKTEDVLGAGVEYTVKMGDEIAGVSVKRIIDPLEDSTTVKNAIEKAYTGLADNADGKWVHNIIHILLKSSDDINTAEDAIPRALGNLQSKYPDIATNFKVVITKVNNLKVFE